MRPLLLAWLVGSLCGSACLPALAATPLEFNRDIRPILSAKCFACHGFDAKKREAELRLDVPEGAFADRDGRAAIRPGSLADSTVWARITATDPDVVMPPPSSHKTLSDHEKALLRRWIEEGATYQKHWAFEAPKTRTVPAPVADQPAINEVDWFLQHQQASAGLQSNPEADRATLIRRVAFTLTGLPPTLAEVEAFVNDRSPTAYEAMVDRYLASPRYGEEMARHWLDVARYADTHGLHLDNEREMWAYRDWVIAAFNRNLPYDQFTIEQIAGDLLPNPTPDQLTATGFNRCNVTTSEGGSIAEEFLYRYAVERASTTTQAWLGLTSGCAVCHDHKFDPLTTKEFYSLYAFFYSSADPAMDGNVRFTAPFNLLPTAEQSQQLAQLKAVESDAAQRLQHVIATVPTAAATPSSATGATTDVWLDDVLPEAQRISTTSRNKASWTNASDEFAVPRGRRALHQSGGDLYQDRFDNLYAAWSIPQQGVISVWVRTDPLEPSKAMMLELATSRGLRRLVLGDNSLLGGGAQLSADRLHRALPAPGEWTQIQIAAQDWNLQPGDQIRSLSFEEFGGLCWWDGLQVQGTFDPAQDPRATFTVWWQNRKGQESPQVPGPLQALLKAGPPAIDLHAPASATAPENSAANLALAANMVELQKFHQQKIARPMTTDWIAAAAAYGDAVAARQTLEDTIPGTFTFQDLQQPRDAFVMMRGQYDKPGEGVVPGVPAVLPPLQLPEGQSRANRLDLARWLVAKSNPLTARVAVNRFWQQVFGIGLVKTSDDFGSQGEPPTHPELLDWLALWYQDQHWDTKQLMKLLVMSSAFRQDAAAPPEKRTADPENRLLARGPRLRLDAEQIRDNALFTSGLLSLKMGGPGVKPYQPPNIWEPVGYANSNTRYFIQDHGEALYRRSIYCFLKRTAPPPFMSNFDGPNREQLCARRERSNTPLQALQTLNDTQHVEAARALAERMIREGGATPQERLEFAFRTILSRPPEPEETTILVATLHKYVERYQSDPAAAEKLVHVGEAPVQALAPTPELAAYTLVANLLLNLDETLNRN